ncbi:MAG: endonuclease/exonuclease/phosphatase family protein [Streptomyces sp.]|nr:endonuclease/exonuclease/phosphatase family protein [Streptomyces sp.]
MTIAVQNLEHGGLKDGEGRPEDRWPLLAERINSAADLDVVMVCEAVDWQMYGHKQLARACRDLDLDAVPLAPSRSGYGTALLYRREKLGRWSRYNPDFGTEALHGLAVTSFDIEGLLAPLSFLPVHFTPFSAEQALIEAIYAATRAYRYGPFAILVGDCNYALAASAHPLPDYAESRSGHGVHARHPPHTLLPVSRRRFSNMVCASSTSPMSRCLIPQSRQSRASIAPYVRHAICSSSVSGRPYP